MQNESEYWFEVGKILDMDLGLLAQNHICELAGFVIKIRFLLVAIFQLIAGFVFR